MKAMKTIFTLILIFFTATLFAQEYYANLITHGDGTAVKPCEYLVNNPCVYTPNTKNNDTLIVPVGKYKFIKVGDKIYKIQSSLEEVKEEQGWKLSTGGTIDTGQIWRNPIYLPRGTFQLPNIYN